MPPRSLRLAAAISLVLTLAFAPNAWAGDPVNTRQTIASADFNSGLGPFTVAETPTELPAAAYWGLRSDSIMRRGTTGQGLWCAGTKVLDVFFTTFPSYPYFYEGEPIRREPVTFNTATKALATKGFAGEMVQNVTVYAAPTGAGKFILDDDYDVGLNAQGSTTITRTSYGRIPAGTTVYVDYAWRPTAGTRGKATLELPQLDDYHYSWASFYYVMPSIGSGDQFGVHWRPSDDPSSPNESVYGQDLPITSSWRYVERQLSGGLDVKLSRDPGTLWFQFHDWTGNPRNGQGPAIDDVKITGYKYGTVPGASVVKSTGGGAPVAMPEYIPSYPTKSNVTLTGLDSGQVKIAWSPPSRSVSDSAPDERPIGYRVWRRLGTGAWTELTSAIDRTNAPEIQDATSAAGAYTYAVQAWDPGQGPGSGMYATSNPISMPAPGVGTPIAAIEYRIDGGVVQTVNGSKYVIGDLGVRPAPYSVTFRVRDADNNWSPYKTFSFSVISPTTFAGVSPSRTLSYGSAGSISATLKTSLGAVIAGQPVTLQRSSNGTSGWTNVETKKTYSNGTVNFGPSASSMGYTKTYYRLAFAGAAGYSGTNGAVRYMDPKAKLGTPKSSKSTVYAKRTYTWSSTISPRHTAGSAVLKLQFQRKVGSKYKAYKTVTAYATTYSSSTSIGKAKYKLPYKGKWRVRAFHDDGGHAPTYSSWLYKTAK